MYRRKKQTRFIKATLYVLTFIMVLAVSNTLSLFEKTKADLTETGAPPYTETLASDTLTLNQQFIVTHNGQKVNMTCPTQMKDGEYMYILLVNANTAAFGQDVYLRDNGVNGGATKVLCDDMTELQNDPNHGSGLKQYIFKLTKINGSFTFRAMTSQVGDVKNRML